MAIEQGFDDTADERIQGARLSNGARLTEIGPYADDAASVPTARVDSPTSSDAEQVLEVSVDQAVAARIGARMVGGVRHEIG